MKTFIVYTVLTISQAHAILITVTEARENNASLRESFEGNQEGLYMTSDSSQHQSGAGG